MTGCAIAKECIGCMNYNPCESKCNLDEELEQEIEEDTFDEEEDY